MTVMQQEAPYSKEAEICVLGGMLIDPEAVAKVASELVETQFYVKAHRLIYRAMLRLFNRGEAIDPMMVAEELNSLGDLDRSGGLPYLAELLDAVPSAAHIEDHIRVVQDRALARDLVAAGQKIVADGLARDGKSVQEKLDGAAQAVFSLATAIERQGPVLARKLIMPVIEGMENRRNTGGPVGVPSGFPDLDRMTGGFQKGDLIILAARPSMGKTSIAVGMMLHAAITCQIPVAIYSLEMRKEQIVQRMLCHEALIDLGAFLRGELRDDEYVRLAHAVGHVNAATILIDDRSDLTVTQIRASARLLKAQIPELGLVVVDYAQLMRGNNAENRQLEVSQISRGLKALAKEIDVPVIALSQLSRAVENRADHRPQLSDLRESGALEQDADLVLFLHRPERYMTPEEAEEKGLVGLAELIIGKHRNGPTGVVDLYFRKESTRFESFSRREAA